MVRTQVQLPDDVYARAKRLAERREVSLAELTRRGLEYILSIYPPDDGSNAVWQPPAPRKLGWRGLDDAELKAEAQRGTAEDLVVRARKTARRSR